MLGSDVYTSNDQLGGVQIMANNGVSHAVVPDELKGIECLLKWLSYMPAVKNGSLPVLRLNPDEPDPIDRHVTYMPPKNQTSSDPRWLITGKLGIC